MTQDELLQVIEKAASDRVKKLDLSGCELSFLPIEIRYLTNLKKIDLSNNKLTSLPIEIGQLTSLNELDLSSNQLKIFPTEIAKLHNLKTIDLSDNRLIEFPIELAQITNLITLKCNENQLMILPGEIEQFNNLNRLEFRWNQLNHLPVEIGQLKNLKILDLGSNQIKDLPADIGNLVNLLVLELDNNQLIDFPITIAQLTNLNTLDLGNNQLKCLFKEIGQLTSLNNLDLSSNRLISLPPEIGQLTKLNRLDLSSNQLVSLPPEVGQLVSLHVLQLNDNPLPSLPLEIRGGRAKDVVNFYRQQLEQETDNLYEAKLLIIGEGGAGKTTLAKKIQDLNYQLQEDEASTDGIEIIQYRFLLENGKEFRVNIWDFGGQQIYHQTHQFFLTKRSLYVLVADARKEDTNFYYWLNVVELLSDNSPLLIIKNEKQNIKLGLNERQLRGEFTSLKEAFATNFADNRGLADIIIALKHYISNLPHVGTELPRTWIKVREALEQQTCDYISLDEYLQICQDNGFTRLEDKLQLSGYLHDLGVCLHFQEDDLLSKTVILKPTWGTDAVYKVLRNSQVTQNSGKFTRDDLAAIWRDDKYATMRPELLRLMMNFKLCYEMPNYPGNYIAPQLLSPEQSEYEWDESENLLLRYEYEFMPKGILTRFIVEMHQWIEQSTCVWKTGVVLSKEGARAEVLELYRYHKGEIRIRVSRNRKRDLLTTVRYELDKIHDSYKSLDDQQNQVQRLKYNTLVPCDCAMCKDSQSPHFYPLERLHKFLDDRRDIQCPVSYDMVNVRGLVDDIAVEAPRVTNARRKRLQTERDRLESEWDLRNPKLTQLRWDWAIATDTATKFQLEQQIQAEETRLKQLEAELDAIDQRLN